MSDLWGQTLLYLERGGLVMPPLILGTLVLWYGLGYRWMTLRRGNLRSVRVLIRKYSEEGYDKPPTGVIDTAVLRGLELLAESERELRQRMDEAFSTLSSEMNKFSTITRVIVAVAPLCGLLGTVGGMVETFSSLGDMSLFAQTGGVAGGISKALFSTQLGLAVAIPGLIVGRILDRRQETLENELAKVKDILSQNEALP